MDLNVLIIGGGIHGVGLLHELATRGVKDVHLVEEKQLASGTSSKSTKLVHGGLRYLEHLAQWGLVHEALHERSLLLKLIPDLVKPVPILLPVFKSDKRPPWLVRTGLFFYDLLAGDGLLPSATSVAKEEIHHYAPYLNKEKIERDMKCAFLYHDAQMLDDVIARLVAFASRKFGATFAENTTVTKIEKKENRFEITLQKDKVEQKITAKHVVNATGAWANKNLINWGFVPKRVCLLNLGSHLIFNKNVTPNIDINSCAGSLIQEPDGRIVFFIPWWERWLMGTTESILNGDPRNFRAPEGDKKYLLDTAQETFSLTDPIQHTDEFFCGARCMPLNKKVQHTHLQNSWIKDPFHSPFYVIKPGENISALSRETVIEEQPKNLYSIYGGKFTTYRAISQKMGRMIAMRLGVHGKSGTHLKEKWFYHELLAEHPEIFQSSRALRSNS